MGTKPQISETARKYPSVAQPKPYRFEGDEPGYDGAPTIFRAVRDPEHAGKRKLTVELRIDPLQWLLDHRDIEQQHFDAGRELQSDFENIRIGGGNVNFNGGGNSGSMTGISDSTCDALRRFGRAWEKIPQRARSTVRYIVLERATANRVSALEHVDRRRIAERLLFGLDELAIFYGFVTPNGLVGLGSR